MPFESHKHIHIYRSFAPFCGPLGAEVALANIQYLFHLYSTKQQQQQPYIHTKNNPASLKGCCGGCAIQDTFEARRDAREGGRDVHTECVLMVPEDAAHHRPNKTEWNKYGWHTHIDRPGTRDKEGAGVALFTEANHP